MMEATYKDHPLRRKTDRDPNELMVPSTWTALAATIKRCDEGVVGVHEMDESWRASQRLAELVLAGRRS